MHKFPDWQYERETEKGAMSWLNLFYILVILEIALFYNYLTASAPYHRVLFDNICSK